MNARSLTRIGVALLTIAGIAMLTWRLTVLSTARALPYAWELEIRDGEMWSADELPGTDRALYPGLVEVSQTMPLRTWIEQIVCWNDGLLARPRTLFFSLPVVVTLKLFPALDAVRVMRAWATAAMVATVVILWFGMGRNLAAVSTVAAFVCWPSYWHYGSYGCAVAGMFCATALAVVATLAFMRSPRLARAVAVLLTLFVCTLQYAPSRIVVLGLLACVVTRARRAPMLVLSLLLACGALAWLQGPVGRHALLHARGEQVLTGSTFVPTDASILVRVAKVIEQNRAQMVHLFGPWTAPVVSALATEDTVGLDAGTPLIPRSWLPIICAAMLLTICQYGVLFGCLPLFVLAVCMLTSGPNLARVSVCTVLWAVQIGVAVELIEVKCRIRLPLIRRIIKERTLHFRALGAIRRTAMNPDCGSAAARPG